VKLAADLPNPFLVPVDITGNGVQITPVDPSHPPTFGLAFNSSGNHITGLTIDGFVEQLSIGTGSNNNLIEGNFLGTNPAGTSAVGGRSGIAIFGAGNMMSAMSYPGWAIYWARRSSLASLS